MKLSQHQTMTQKQVMTRVMQQSIEVLLLPVLDLEQTIAQELETNPLLEIDEVSLRQKAAEAADHAHTPEVPFIQSMSDEIQKLMKAPEHPFLPDSFEEDVREDMPLKFTESLEEKLLRQLHIDLDDPLKIRIGEMLIGQLDEDGYLTANIEEIAQAMNLGSHSLVKDVLRLIQSYEPVGIAARDLKECLTIQANAKFNGSTPLTLKIIQEHLPSLGRKRYDLIARNLKTPVEHVRQCAQIIATLEPRPARNFRPISESNYVKPDIIIHESLQTPGEYQIEVNEKGVPPLRINPVYRQLIKKKDLSELEKQFLREKLQSALAFIKSMQQRGSTIKQIGTYILEKQKGFFDNGHLDLKPMSLKDVAKAIDRNESTISRAISQKYIDTPRGIFPLKYFFSQSVGNTANSQNEEDEGHGTSNRTIKEEICQIVADEDKTKPLADSEIQGILKERNIRVARRTIGKYRKQLKILPSHLRKI